MKAHARRFLVLFFALLLTTTSCGGGAGEATDTTAVDTSTDTTDVETEKPDPLAHLPEMDFEGYDFRLNLRNDDKWVKDQIAEEMTGEVVNDAVFKRNTEIMERYNLKISHTRSSHSNGDMDAKESIQAGDDAYDLISNHPRNVHVYANQGMALNWNDFQYVDLTKPWWDQDAAESFQMPGGLYCMIGDNSHESVGATFAMLFNKDLFDANKLEYPYQMVKDGKWTFDVFAQMAETYSQDLDGDGTMTDKDLYGYVTHHWVGPIQAFYSSGSRVIAKGSETYEFDVYNERSISMYEKYFALLAAPCTSIDKDSPSSFDGSHLKLFQEGLGLFLDVNLTSVQYLREMDHNFGIVPWPKLEESAEEYWSNVDAGTNLFFVPITVTNTDRTSLVLETMAILGREYCIPAYYDVALKTRDSRDEDSAEMLDIILQNRVFDLGYYNEPFGGSFSSHFETLCKSGQEFSSWYEKQLKASTTKKEQTIQDYKDRMGQ